MSTVALVMMVLICAFLWGGFTTLLVRALRKEGAKTAARIDEHPPHPSP